MNAGLWAALGYAAGSLATVLALQPVLRARYQRGKADGYCDRYEQEYDRIKAQVDAAYQRGRAEGKAEGWTDLAKAVVRDMGPEGARQFADRVEAMNKVDAIARGAKQ